MPHTQKGTVSHMNILDYLDWRGDLTFAERPFNEVDNLIFSELAYAEMENIVPESFAFTVSLRTLCESYLALGYQSVLINDPLPLLQKAAVCERYRDVRVGGYLNRVDEGEQMQFAAMTFALGDGTLDAAFRGTDNTIVGWREDFNISFLPETPGQAEAAAYLNRLAAASTCPIRVGGHSKGGNFAVYAAAFCEEELNDNRRIVEVYSNDGPGFNSSAADSLRYKAILPKVKKIVPESSLIGLLLSSWAERRVIRSDAKGLLQHDPYTWSVVGDHFVAADGLSPESTFMDETLAGWIDSMDNEQKKAVVSAIFDSMEASGASTITEMNENKWLSYSAIGKALGALDKTTADNVTASLKKLFDAGKDVFREQWEKALQQNQKTISVRRN